MDDGNSDIVAATGAVGTGAGSWLYIDVTVTCNARIEPIPPFWTDDV